MTFTFGNRIKLGSNASLDGLSRHFYWFWWHTCLQEVNFKTSSTQNSFYKLHLAGNKFSTFDPSTNQVTTEILRNCLCPIYRSRLTNAVSADAHWSLDLQVAISYLLMCFPPLHTNFPYMHQHIKTGSKYFNILNYTSFTAVYKP